MGAAGHWQIRSRTEPTTECIQADTKDTDILARLTRLEALLTELARPKA